MPIDLPTTRRIRARLPRILMTLAIGVVGSLVFQALALPLPWMLGSMLATTTAAVGGLPVALPQWMRRLMSTVLGVMLGSAFTSDLLDRLPLWTGSLAALVLYVAVTMVLCQFYYRRIGGYDPTTAYFTAAPGGLSPMVMIGTAMGGDERAISLGQAARILLIVLLLPLGLQLFGGYQPANRPSGGEAISAIPPQDLLILLLCAVVGYVAASRARLPAADLVGPMILSALAHLSGLTQSRPPAELVALAQLIVGASIGVRFTGTRIGEILRALVLAVGASAILLVVTILFSMALHGLMDLPLQGVVLAFAPGGVAEMSLIALALGIDVAYVATHHIMRIFLIVAGAPLFFRLLRQR